MMSKNWFISYMISSFVLLVFFYPASKQVEFAYIGVGFGITAALFRIATAIERIKK